MKIKENTQVTTDDFWYDLIEGGYIKPSDVLDSGEDIRKVLDAVKTLKDFRESLEDIIEYM